MHAPINCSTLDTLRHTFTFLTGKQISKCEHRITCFHRFPRIAHLNEVRFSLVMRSTPFLCAYMDARTWKLWNWAKFFFLFVIRLPELKCGLSYFVGFFKCNLMTFARKHCGKIVKNVYH